VDVAFPVMIQWPNAQPWIATINAPNAAHHFTGTARRGSTAAGRVTCVVAAAVLTRRLESSDVDPVASKHRRFAAARPHEKIGPDRSLGFRCLGPSTWVDNDHEMFDRQRSQG
jgi:hypothetical protein